MKTRVGLRGSTRLAKHLAQAVTAQTDMLFAGVSGWSNLDDLAAACGYDVVEPADQLASVSDILLDVTPTTVRIFEAYGGFAQYDNAIAFTALTNGSSLDRGKTFYIPDADTLALARVAQAIHALGHVDRLYTTIISRGAHASDAAQASLDALEPVIGERELDAQVKLVLADMVSICQVRRITAPYTHSHLHMIKLDIADVVERDVVVSALQKDSRILVGHAKDGFRSTADINEFFRDLNRNTLARSELFVWDESIMVVNSSVYLMLDILPQAVPIPEAIDAIRLLASPQLEWAAIRKLTDDSLGLLQSIML